MNISDPKLPDLSALVERVLISADGLDLWWAIGTKLASAAGATKKGIYIHHDIHRGYSGLRELVKVERRGEHVHENDRVRYQLRSQTYAKEADIPYSSYADEFVDRRFLRLALRCFVNARVEMDSSSKELIHLAIPVLEHLDKTADVRPMAVFVLELPGVDDETDRALRSHLLGSLLPQLHPFAVYARARYLLPDIRRDLDIWTTPFNHLIDDLLKRICRRLGFSYALISLVNEGGKEVMAIRGRNVPRDWLEAARHPLSSSDIVADVLRRGKSEVFHANDHPDSRFDSYIFDTFDHKNLERVFVPLAKIGVLEAGWRDHEDKHLSTVMLTSLEHWASEVGSVLAWKLEHERQREATTTLSRILEAGHELSELRRLGPQSYRVADLRGFLGNLAERACSALQSDIVIIYPIVPVPASRFSLLTPSELTFLTPIVRGRPLKGGMILHPPRGTDDIASSMLRDFATKGTKQRYVVDPQTDAGFSPIQHHESADGFNADTNLFNFAEKQGIKAFAGVVLEAYGDVIGVLCLNFTKSRAFPKQDQYLVEMFAQQAMDMLSSDWLATLRELSHIHDRLHDTVRSRLAALLTDFDHLTKVLESRPEANDDVTHTLVSRITTLLDRMYDELQEILRGGSGDVWSEISLEVTPQRSDLAADIREAVAEITPAGDRRIELQISENLPSLPKYMRESIVGIVTGLVSNAIRHSGATRIKVQVECDDIKLDVTVTDDGIGFDTAKILTSVVHGPAVQSGIGGHLRRAQWLGAGLDFSSFVGRGTQCHLSVPISINYEGSTRGSNIGTQSDTSSMD